MKVLWADDQGDVVATLSTALFHTADEVEFVRDGDGALARLASERYDVVLLDLAMPPGLWGGLWLLEQLRSLPAAPPVIVVSGEGSQSETIRALRLGASDYVLKERLHEELLERIVTVLAERSSATRIEQQIAQGETDRLEFKATLRFNLRSGKNDSKIEAAVLKTIAGFLNARGGTLLIGVTDNGQVSGISADRFESTDKFQLHFWNIFRDAIGGEFSEFVQSELCDIHGGVVFCVNCLPSNRPVFMKGNGGEGGARGDMFFVRAGPQTEALNFRQALDYIDDHFKERR